MIHVFILFFTHILFYWTAVIFYTVLYKQWRDNSSTVIHGVLQNQFIYTPLYIIPYYYYPEPKASEYIG